MPTRAEARYALRAARRGRERRERRNRRAEALLGVGVGLVALVAYLLVVGGIIAFLVWVVVTVLRSLGVL